MFMSGAADVPPAASRSLQADTQEPSRSRRLLNLIRKLIDYGKELAATLQQRSATTELAPIMRGFGTRDIAQILARVMRGLQRAQALEGRIISSAARLDADPKPQAARSAPPQSRPRAAKSAVLRTDQADPNVTPLPTPEQIAAEVRRRPIGAVIADICRDLGILPNHPLWRELQRAIDTYRGNYARLVLNILARPLLILPEDEDRLAATQGVLPALACTTGPP
jgi:hypothetical protein